MFDHKDNWNPQFENQNPQPQTPQEREAQPFDALSSRQAEQAPPVQPDPARDQPASSASWEAPDYDRYFTDIQPDPYGAAVSGNAVQGQPVDQNAEFSAPDPEAGGEFRQDTFNQNFSWDAGNPYDASPLGTDGRMTALYNPQPPEMFFQQEEKTKRRSKQSTLSKKAAAAILTLAVVLSGAAGAGSVLVTSRLMENKSASTSSTGSGLSTTAVNAATGSSSSVEAVAAAAADSVVEITTESVTTDKWMQQMISEGAGSGVIISQDGKIVTNNHVIEGARKITVRLRNGDTYPATLVGTDSKTDVALLKIDATGLTAATFGNSDNLKVGQPAVAIGNPLGELGGTVTDGIISALNRDITIDGETMNLLQTNAAINPGNSGGGLFDVNGNLIGIVVAKSSGTGVEGLGFAIPINQVASVVEQLSSNGYVTGRAQLGVSLVDIQDAQTAMMYRVSRTGVYVLKVSEGSAAEQAGLQAGDCILSVDGTEVSSSSDLTTILGKHAVGDTLKIQVLRSGQTLTLSATLQEQTPDNTSST